MTCLCRHPADKLRFDKPKGNLLAHLRSMMGRASEQDQHDTDWGSHTAERGTILAASPSDQAAARARCARLARRREKELTTKLLNPFRPSSRGKGTAHAQRPTRARSCAKWIVK